MAQFTYNFVKGASDADYCPYCDKRHAPQQMSDEHVIPASIGGKLVIRACRACNSRLGERIDPLLTRQILVRLMAAETGSALSSHDRIRGGVKLKDGRVVEGFLSISFLDRGTFALECDPVKVQADGSQWIHARASNPQLPPEINVLKVEDVESTYFEPTDPTEVESPAIVKIVLGVLYYALGSTIIQRPEFNVLRSCLSGTMCPEVVVTPLPLRPNAPEEVGTHFVYAECEDGRTLRGGVSIFGRIKYELRIERFGCHFPGRSMEHKAFSLPT
jgi:hypothetical protein